MRVSTLFTVLLPMVAFGSAQESHTTSICTQTQTRTVIRVFTETRTGSPNATSYAPKYTAAWAANSTSVAPTGAIVSPTVSVYNPSASNSASIGSFNVALAAIAGAVAYVAL